MLVLRLVLLTLLLREALEILSGQLEVLLDKLEVLLKAIDLCDDPLEIKLSPHVLFEPF